MTRSATSVCTLDIHLHHNTLSRLLQHYDLVTTELITSHITRAMEDLEVPTGSPSYQDDLEEEPQGNADPGDPLNPEIEEEDSTRTPPLADPTADMEARDDDEAPETVDAMNNDDDSELDELDEAQFDNFDPETANITVPVAVDESNVGLIGVHKRKRTEAEESERKKKKKEGRREKPKKAKRVRAGGDDEDDFEGGPELDGKRQRKRQALGPDGKPVKAVRRARTPENEDNLSPEERESA
jgi:transcription factor SPN1